jgi:hypothetical protein
MPIVNEVFNLVPEKGIDVERLKAEARARAKARRERRRFQKKQLKFA